MKKHEYQVRLMQLHAATRGFEGELYNAWEEYERLELDDPHRSVVKHTILTLQTKLRRIGRDKVYIRCKLWDMHARARTRKRLFVTVGIVALIVAIVWLLVG